MSDTPERIRAWNTANCDGDWTIAEGQGIPYVRADRIEALEDELHIMQTASIAEVAARNISVAEYMAHWEVRAEKAEAENKRLRDAVQEAFAHMDCSEAYLILKHALAQKGGE